MSKENIYRAFDKIHKVMDDTEHGLRVDFSDGDVYVCNSRFDFEDYELMEFCGKIDKNKVKIFDKDILQSHYVIDENVLVFWNEHTLQWQVKRSLNTENMPLWEYLFHYPNTEVIGNELENPELLEEK